MKRWLKRIVWVCLVLAAAALLGYAFIAAPVEVDLARVDRGPMRVTVDQEGKTRVKERYVISAPLAGQLQRIPWEAGDPVKAGETVLAAIHPVAPSLLDVRATEESTARVRGAEAALQRTEPAILRAQAELAQARTELARTRELADSGVASPQELEDKSLLVKVKEAELKSARSAQDVARFELEQAKAALVRMTTPSATQPAAFEILSPIDGQVLRVIQESATPVIPGAQLLEVGDVSQIEAEIDVLSRDAVKIRPGAKVFFERWGGEAPLQGTVWRVEPSGFTKISALGVEEQRVNVIADLTVPPGQRPPGDYYRVDARIVVWERSDVLKAPTGALFRQGERWAVYVVQDGRAVRRTVQIGRMNGLEAEVLDGLTVGEQVILHPSDKVEDGVGVTPRPQE